MIDAPVIYDPASDANKTANPAISSVVPARPKETLFINFCSAPSNSNNAALNYDLTYPGQIALTLILYFPHSKS